MTRFESQSMNPPTVPGDLSAEAPQTRWPTVIGVISLIYAIFGLLCNFLGAGWYLAMPYIPEMWRGGMEVSLGFRLVVAAQALASMILGILLLTGAVSLLKRRRVSAARLTRWVVLVLMLIVVGLVTGILTIPAQIEMQRSAERYAEKVAAENPNARVWMSSPKTDDELWQQQVVTNVAMSVIFSIYPLFVGLWLSRQKIKDEVAQWE